jgi:hypothetical protein
MNDKRKINSSTAVLFRFFKKHSPSRSHSGPVGPLSKSRGQKNLKRRKKRQIQRYASQASKNAAPVPHTAITTASTITNPSNTPHRRSIATFAAIGPITHRTNAENEPRKATASMSASIHLQKDGKEEEEEEGTNSLR